MDDQQIQKQLDIEGAAVNAAVSKYKQALREGIELPPHFALLRMAFEPTRREITKLLVTAHVGGAPEQRKIRSQLSQVSVDALTYLTLWSLIGETPGNPLQTICRNIAIAVKEHIEYEQLKTASPHLVTRLQTDLNRRTQNKQHRREVMRSVAKTHGAQQVTWGPKSIQYVGKTLLDCVISSTGMWQIHHILESGERLNVVYPSVETARWLLKAHRACTYSSIKCLPCVIPPQPWTDSGQGGGYYSGVGAHNLSVVRTRHQTTRAAVITAKPSNVYTALSALQNTPYCINGVVLETVNAVWQHTSGMGVLPSPDSVEFPTKPWGDTVENWAEYKHEHMDEVAAWAKGKTKAHEEQRRIISQAIAVGYIISRARQFAHHEHIYFVWSCDYRGRMYPSQPHLNPQGNDLARGLLQFADGQRLGASGVRWLAIHGANCYGYDKATLDDRVAWVREHVAQILDSARNPLDGTRFWTEADDPWQFLAFCFEWAGVSEQGEDFVSYLPVSVDGSCSGLQHFSALLLDEAGAGAVNLLPSDKPSDIYQRVCNLLIEKVAADLDSTEVLQFSNYQIAFREMAEAWQGRITRQIVKRGVMTTPYGVTPRGIKDQILAEMYKEGPDLVSRGTTDSLSSDRRDWWRNAYYLSIRLHETIAEVVTSAKAAQEWLQAVAGLYAQAELPVSWVAPSGWLIVQRYVRQKFVRLDTMLGSKRIRIGLYEDTDRIDGKKGVTSIAPNVIHSLDASHMVATILACQAAGITSFAMIHDSFGSHAANMEDMSRILREEFVRLYSADQLRALSEQLKSGLPEKLQALFPEPPTRGTLNLSDTLSSTYSFA